MVAAAIKRSIFRIFHKDALLIVLLVVDPDPVGSDTSNRIRKKSFQIQGTLDPN
jgi:hypothetical protein